MSTFSAVANLKVRFVAVALPLLGLATPTLGQERVVLEGKVVASGTLEPLPGARVVAPLSDVSTLTDSLGNFEISFIQDTRYELVAAAMGYQPVRLILGSEAEYGSTRIPLPPDQQAMAALAVLRDRLDIRRRRRRTRRLRIIDNVELSRSRASTAYDLVREVAAAQPCADLRALCRFGRSQVRLCIDDSRPNAGARELEDLRPSDLWLIEVYNEGREVRVYSRWFIDRTIRTRQGEIRLNPIC